MVTAIATACTNISEPTAPLSPSGPLAAKNKIGPTHPAAMLVQTVPFISGPWGIAVSSSGVVLTALPSANMIGGFSLSDPSAQRPTLTVDGSPLDIIINGNGTLADTKFDSHMAVARCRVVHCGPEVSATAMPRCARL
jgi:hypothetical protein